MGLPTGKEQVELLAEKEGITLIVSCIETKYCPPVSLFASSAVRHELFDWPNFHAPSVEQVGTFSRLLQWPCDTD
jgi:hypothetical protein